MVVEASQPQAAVLEQEVQSCLLTLYTLLQNLASTHAYTLPRCKIYEQHEQTHFEEKLNQENL